MEIKIFYSWQTNTNTKYNKNFIYSSIEKAIKKTKAKPEFASIDFKLLEGVRGESGSPPVASKINDERIPDCDIFIADLSVVNKIPSLVRTILKLFGYNLKPAQNNNVINEHGVAYNALGYEKIIGVLNEVFGSPNDNPDNIPFDIRHLRFPIEYNYSKKTKNREKSQSQLVEDLTNALSISTNFALQHQRDKFSPLNVWEEWAKNISTNQKFIQNELIEGIKNIILSGIRNPKESIRLLGLSGLGKTRILFETFRPMTEKMDSINLSSRVLYLNCNLYPTTIYTALFAKLEKSKEARIVILDNCSKGLHRQLLPTIRKETNKISLISVDSNPEEVEQDKINGVNYIVIKKEDLSSIVNEILIQDFSMLPPETIEKVKEFSQGIPLMAVLLGESIKNGEQFIGKLDDKELLDKLLGQRGSDLRCRTILKSCAIFNYFGVKDELRSQMEFIATNKNITSLNGENQVIVQEFDELLIHYLRREIFERKGRLIGMRPFPLAISLAQEWLSICTRDRLTNVITSIVSLPDRDRKQLTEALSEQMKYLGYDNNALFIVENIVGLGSPFDNAEVLNTELGSRLFRSFVEVNPVAICNNLVRVFSTKTTKELLEIREGRRNLVWVLEKLCFDKRTFLNGAKLMYSFAVAENETWSNNATGQLLQLFNIILSGTEANLADRWEIIEWGLNQQQKEFSLLALKAMRVGLNYGHFSRNGGAEKQGTKTLQDYQPSWKEIGEYWTNILNCLSTFAKSDTEYAQIASETISNSIRSICHARLTHLVIPIIEDISKFKNYDWDEAWNGLRNARKFEKSSLSDEQLNSINSLIESLTKKDFETRYIKISSSFHLEDDESYSTEKLKEAIISLADEFINNNLSWELYIPIFYKNQQFYSYFFGSRIYELIKEHEEKPQMFIDLSIKAILRIDKQNRDISVLVGFISEAEDNLRKLVYSSLLQHDDLAYLMFNFVSQDNNGKVYFNDLFSLVDERKCELENFNSLIHGGAIANLDLNELIGFSKNLFKYGDKGFIIVFNILFALTYKNNSLFQSVTSLLKECIYRLGFNINHKVQIDDFKWVQIVCTILENKEEEFASFINKSIIDSISPNNTYHLDYEIQRTYGILIKTHFKTVWPYLASSLLYEGEEYIKFYGLKHILGSHIGGVGLNVGILFTGDVDEIFKWCENNKPLAPARLAELVPIFSGNNDEYEFWHPISLRLLDEFGDIEEVLSNLGANMGSFSWIGSIVPLLEGRKTLFSKLINHKYKSVSDWANRNIISLEKQIEFEKNQDEELHIV